MKKLKFIPILLFLISSCSNSDTKNSLISGEWNLSEYYLIDGIGITSTSGILDYETQITHKGENLNVDIVFSEAPNVVNSTGIYTSIYTRNNSNNTDTSSLTPETVTPFKDFTKWTLENDILSLEDEANNLIENYSIIELNENTLKLEYQLNKIVTNIDGSITEDSGTYIITFIR